MTEPFFILPGGEPGDAVDELFVGGTPDGVVRVRAEQVVEALQALTGLLTVIEAERLTVDAMRKAITGLVRTVNAERKQAAETRGDLLGLAEIIAKQTDALDATRSALADLLRLCDLAAGDEANQAFYLRGSASVETARRLLADSQAAETCATCSGEGRIAAYGTGDQAGGYAETCLDRKGTGRKVAI